jgi:hypothetical protein
VPATRATGCSRLYRCVHSPLTVQDEMLAAEPELERLTGLGETAWIDQSWAASFFELQFHVTETMKVRRRHTAAAVMCVRACERALSLPRRSPPQCLHPCRLLWAFTPVVARIPCAWSAFRRLLPLACRRCLVCG